MNHREESVLGFAVFISALFLIGAFFIETAAPADEPVKEKQIQVEPPTPSPSC